MRTLYLECNMGAAGDMLSAALLELLPDRDDFIKKLNSLEIPGVCFHAEQAKKCGITGTHMSVTVYGAEEGEISGHADHHSHTHHAEQGHVHTHHGLHEIEHMVSHMKIPQTVKDDVMGVYRLIADAESHVHGQTVEEIHFHEVGALDAVADVTAVCMLIHELSPDQIIASPVHVGGGQVQCAHGILPVPAPATAWILREVPTWGGSIQGELCTPTGAALLKYFVTEFGSQPPMRVERIGYGCGKRDYEMANCMRASLGETSQNRDMVIELSCNLDDMTPEAIGFAMERLFQAGALDVYTVPIGMKKNRPGILFSCMCRSSQREEMVRLIFTHTTTLGIRESVCNRYTLQRSIKTVDTAYGSVRVKTVSGWGVSREKPEYDDLAKIAAEREISLSQAAALLHDLT